MTKPIDFYYILPSPPCRAVMMAAKALDIPLNLKLVDLLSGEQMKPEYLAMNPEHTVPTIVDHETGLTLGESHAIMPYLVNQYAPGNPLYPSDAVTRAKVDKWLHFSNATLFNAGKAANRPHIFGNGPTEEAVQALKETIKMMDTLISKAGTQFLAADHVTIADLCPSVGLELTLALQGWDSNDWPAVHAWLERVKETAVGYKEVNEGVVPTFLEKIKEIKAKRAEEAAAAK